MRHGLGHSEGTRAWREHDLAGLYDAVIVGGGGHGLATAHYLAANHGMTNVAVIDNRCSASRPPGSGWWRR